MLLRGCSFVSCYLKKDGRITTYNKRSENITVAAVLRRYSMCKLQTVQAERRTIARSNPISTAVAATQKGNCNLIRHDGGTRKRDRLTKGIHFPVHISHGFGISHSKIMPVSTAIVHRSTRILMAIAATLCRVLSAIWWIYKRIVHFDMLMASTNSIVEMKAFI